VRFISLREFTQEGNNHPGLLWCSPFIANGGG
jgi:hypothetical protein